MSENQAPYGGAPGEQPGPNTQNPHGQNTYDQAAMPSYPGGGQLDLAAYNLAPAGMPPLAHWGLRALAAMIDLAVIGVPNLLVSTVAGRWPGTAVGLLGLVVLAYLEGTKGQTLGKTAIGTRTVSEDNGQLLGFGLALARRFAHILDALACGLGYLWPLWDDKRQTFADKLASSVVIKS